MSITMNVNKAIIVGRITNEVELRSTTSGTKVASMSVATNNVYTNKEGNKIEEAEFHNITLWGRLAEIAGEYLTKGQEVCIEGRIKTDKYEDKEGITKYSTKIIAEKMQMGSKPKGTKVDSVAKEEVPTINLDDESDVKIENVAF